MIWCLKVKNRYFYDYREWEDYKNGMYKKPISIRLISGETEEERLNKVIELFSNQDLTRKYMQRVIDEWKIACKVVFSDPSMNKVAWLGQSACCIYAGITESETRKAWWMVSQENRDKADEIAKELIKKYREEEL